MTKYKLFSMHPVVKNFISLFLYYRFWPQIRGRDTELIGHCRLLADAKKLKAFSRKGHKGSSCAPCARDISASMHVNAKNDFSRQR